MATKKKPQPMANQPKILQAEVSFLNLAFESYFPTRVRAIVDGSLGHSGIWIKEIKTIREGNTFNIEIITEGSLGFGVPVQFHEQVPLDVTGLSPGSYSVQVGDQTATFDVLQETIMIPSDRDPTVDRPQPARASGPAAGSGTSLMERASRLGLISHEKL